MIVDEIVEAHDWRIRAVNDADAVDTGNPETGARFEVTEVGTVPTEEA